MDENNRNAGSVQGLSATQSTPSISGAQGSSASPSVFSLDDNTPSGTGQAVVQPPENKPNPLVRLAKRADVILAILLVLGGAGLFLSTFLSRGDNGAGSAATSKFDPLELPLEDLVTDEGVNFGSQRVTVNGELEVNGDFVLAPSLQPSSATAGQLYYDQTSNVLAYYNGTAFVPVGAGVVSLQGQSGDITLSGAGGITVADDGAGNITLIGPGAGTAGVTSLNGLTGGLTVADASTTGSTITINDATTTSKGIASFNGTNFSVSGGVVNTVQNINTGATPTFAGVNTNTIQGGASLSLLSGGNVTVGTSNATGTLLVVDTKTSAGDPTGVDGAIYYNSNSGNFRCYQGGAWTNCITASGGFVSLQNAYDNSTPAIVNLNATNDGILVRDTAGGIGGNLFAVQNSDGSDDYLRVTTSGIFSQGDAELQGGDVTIGSSSQIGSLVLRDGTGQITVLQPGDSAGNLTFVLPTGAGSQFQCLKKGTGNQLIWDACDGGGGGTSTDLQEAYENGNTILASDLQGDIAFTLNGATNFLTNITGTGRFAVQSSGTDIMGVTPAAVTLGTNVDLLLQGATAYISNPQTQSASEAFGLNASVTDSNAVAVGNSASAGANGVSVGSGATGSGTAVGLNAASNGGGIAIGQNAAASSGAPGVAIGNGASTTANNSVALGHGATAALRATALGHAANADSWGIALGRAATAGQREFVVGSNFDDDNYINQIYFGQGSRDDDISLGTRSITINATGAIGTDLQGATMNLAGGRSTGNAAGGDINLQVSLPAGSGGTLNSLTTALNVSGNSGVVSLGTSGAGGLNGQLAWRNTTNTNTITVQGEVATANQTITLPNATGTVCLTSGNCAGVGGTGDVLQNGNAFGTTMTLGTNDNFDFGLETRGTTWVTLEGATLQADSAPRVVLTSNVDLIMQGATAYISNPQSASFLNSESFGLNATITEDDQVVVGNGARGAGERSTVVGRLGNSGAAGCNDATLVGYNITCLNNNGVAIGSGAHTGGGVAIGLGAQGNTGDAIGIGRNTIASSGGVAVGGGASASGPAVVLGGGASGSTGSVVIGNGASSVTNNSIAIGLGAIVNTNANDSIVIGEGATAGGSAQSNHLVIGSNAMSIQQGFIGNGVTNATPAAFTLNATGGNGTNIQGANLNIAGGKGTGSANGGNINFQVTFGGQTSGTALRTLQTVGTFSGTNGSFTLQNAVDSASAFRVLNQAGTVSVLSVDTSTPGIVVNGAGTDASGGTITIGGGANAPVISREAAAFFGPDPDVLTFETTAMQITNSGSTLFQMEGFNGRFTFRNANDSFGWFQYVDTSDNTLFGVNNVAGNGEATFQNNTDSNIAFRVLNASTVPQFVIDTTGSRVYVGNPTADSTGALLVLDTKNTSGDPAGVNGGMYYNSNRNTFRCYENGFWRDCMEGSRTNIRYRTDMISINVSDSVFGHFANGGTIDEITGLANHPGILQASTSTSTTGNAGTAMENNGDNWLLLGNGDTWRYETALRIPTLSSGTQPFTVRSGFQDNFTGDSTDGCYFRYSDSINGGEWQGVCADAGTTTCDSNIVVSANTWYRLTIVVNSTGTSADFQINGASACQVASNIPDTAGNETNVMSTITKDGTGSTARTLDQDYIEITADMTPR